MGAATPILVNGEWGSRGWLFYGPRWGLPDAPGGSTHDAKSRDHTTTDGSRCGACDVNRASRLRGQSYSRLSKVFNTRHNIHWPRRPSRPAFQSA